MYEISEEEYEFMHYGTKRHSGRYPWGSGDDPQQRSMGLLGAIDELKKQGMNDTDIARNLGMSTKEFRERRSLAKAEQRAADQARVTELKDKGWSNTAIAEKMGITEGTVRNYLKSSVTEKTNATQTTKDMLKRQVEEKGYIDVGVGVERYIGVSRQRMNTALTDLKDEGYTVHYLKVKQLGTGKDTTMMVLAPPGTTYGDVSKNRSKIRQVTEYSEDGGRTMLGIKPPVSVDSKRIKVRYAEEGGNEKDGVIELRRGKDDLSLGGANYAQVRIAVDGTHYLKGMAMYSDKIPDGVDIIFNTNKKQGTPKMDTFKKMKDDPDNPFGSTINRQMEYTDAKGKKHLSPLNIVNEEGSWGNWSKSISSQVLSKQTPELAKKQLKLAYDMKKEEFDEIMSLTNPVIKQKLLQTFGDECDSAAVHLKAAAMPRQRSQVILPVPGIKENEVYAPNYRHGEKVVLIRHPHAGPFEIPELTVNNKNKEAISTIGKNPKDAVGIHPKTAEKLSGADFDGDSVLVIPNNSGSFKTAATLKELKNFDPKDAYPGYEGMKKMDKRTKGIEMGKASNLITDMTIKGASPSEIAKAVKHSMVVIDAEKHGLNWKQSYRDNDIAMLTEKYQGKGPTGALKGASTLISRASSEVRVPERKERVIIDPKTGEKHYTETGRTYVDKKGKTQLATQSSTRMAETKDAYELSSGTKIESIYADHANSLKSLGNQARKEMIATPKMDYSPSARKTYADEYASLSKKLDSAKKNAPLERQAQLVANEIVKLKKQANPDLVNDKEALKKVKNQALQEARLRTGAGKELVKITDKEWEAIQAGAISSSMLKDIMDNTDLDALKQRAMPRETKGLSNARAARAKAMLANGCTYSDIADALGVSVTTITEVLA